MAIELAVAWGYLSVQQTPRHSVSIVANRAMPMRPHVTSLELRGYDEPTKRPGNCPTGSGTSSRRQLGLRNP